ncbi:MAG: sodium:proton symporter [Roseibium sp.]|uniref:sodium:proton symporter n=1 Tax=Roseibium sp. TaxID=1936156 RepID=UPI001B2C0A0D|nr:sodium:proton symporter [Roseibium sp.]MBO6894804.1 sodium:proton symporter [Roseibium sp.]MBO6929389.1 sodium:proton symporter [Roseibium sp.]
MIRGIGGGLAWIGRHGTAALAICIFIGMALPALSSTLRPYLPLSVFSLLTLAFLRVDHQAIRMRLRRPALLLLALVWMMLGAPLLTYLAIEWTGLADFGPDVVLALYIATAAPPVMAAPAFMFLLGLDGTLSLALSVAAMIITPLTAPFIGELMLGSYLPLSVGGLAVQLSMLLVGAFLFSIILRKIAGEERLARSAHHISGLNVLLLLVFAIAAMDGVAASFAAKPLYTLALTGLTFCLAFAQIGLTLLIFVPATREDAYAIAHTCGTRNMGLMVAAFGGTLPEFTWLWFAVGQFPIYMLPMFLKPFVRVFCRLNAKTVTQQT